jgi:hypothetical protein
LVFIVLVTVSVNPWDTISFDEATRVKNDLIGPVRSVMVKKNGYSTTETYDCAGHLIDAVRDLSHANTATHSLIWYDPMGS